MIPLPLISFLHATANFFAVCMLFSPLAAIIIPVTVHRLKNGHRITYWQENALPLIYPYNAKTHVEMFVAFGLLMSFREDNSTMRSKLVWIHRYLNRHFPKVNHQVLVSYQGVRENGINLREVIGWVNRHFKQQDKNHLLSFLIDLATSNGDINGKELQLISYLMKQWRISVYDLPESSQQAFFGPEKEATTSQSRSSLTAYYRDLELEDSSSLEDIKRAYRRLVKKYHPDRYQFLQKGEKEAYQKRFLQIQKAYEILTDHWR